MQLTPEPTAARHETRLRVPASHPALPGHFPGQPIVPAVVLLESVLQAAEHWLGRALSVNLPRAKFSAPLLPEQDARLELNLAGKDLRFVIEREGEILAQGTFTLGAGA